ncbi:hypothetical protein BL254_23810 [Protofrankia sp. BMG5.30]|uniref:Uncharacterized protein n=1 Tax=Protofrankia coriariae TaxID=1562887 RepID=A0ABR5F6S8_9ACTN|nr:hypothetical protein FrCorBMG51_03785 [Protofrankia coriariae]ONH30747.1 hypothetical protein BL254_23810 [Protofrankia sp. BMG5.30]
MQIGASVAAKAQGRRRPHTAQIAAGSRKQFTQVSGWLSRACRAIARTAPQTPQGRRGRSAQRAQNGCPRVSRVATGLTTPQRAQAVASWRCRQRGHNPAWPSRVSGRSARPQTEHAGAGRAEPRAISSVTSRPTAGGAPVDSAAGPAASASARLRSAAPFMA